jgi:hypothetical protein
MGLRRSGNAHDLRSGLHEEPGLAREFLHGFTGCSQ